MRPERDAPEPRCIKGRLKDLVAFLVMFKEGDQFAVLHHHAVGIQADVVTELIVFCEKFVVKPELCSAVAAVCDPDPEGYLLKSLSEAALIVNVVNIADHLIGLHFLAVKDDAVGKPVDTGVQLAALGKILSYLFYASGKAESVSQGKDREDHCLHCRRPDKNKQQDRKYYERDACAEKADYALSAAFAEIFQELSVILRFSISRLCEFSDGALGLGPAVGGTLYRFFL